MTLPDPITRLNAALSGRYEIERELGEGGMATVYLADDLKHERKIALKVLKPELAAVVGAERFLTEIKTTANLSHPHILPLFDSGEADGFLFYVMPYVEGESLRERLDREHQLPVADAVRIATNMAEALDYAHRQGVIHRDIKPANVLLQDGKPVISDFGIALAVGVAGGGRLTETGLSLGTPHYMSPEQATGDLGVAPATDVYALGCVLYEMLVGEPPYTGSTAQAILGKIIAGELATATKQRASVPANVDAAIRKALEKLPADRFTGAQDFAKALADPGFRYGEGAAAVVAVSAGPWKRVAMATTGLAILLGAGLGWELLNPPPPPQAVERFLSPFGTSQEPSYSDPAAFNLAPDGSLLVYRDAGFLSGNQLWVRRWHDLEPSPVAGTEDGHQPVVSPDGGEVAFTQGGEIKVVSLQGGPVRTLMPGTWPSWGSDGYVYGTGGPGIVRVLATGGPAEPVYDEGGSQHWGVLPGGQTALVTAGGQIRILRLESGEAEPLTRGALPRYAPSGHLVYLLDGTLMASRFEADEGALLGPPVPLVEDVGAFSLSDDGKLVYTRRQGEAARLEFVWVSRSGQATPAAPGHSFVHPGDWSLGLSADETRIVFNSVVAGNQDVWIKHIPDGPEERITFSEDPDVRPLWTPDGRSVTYFSGPTTDDYNVYSRRADGTGDRVLLLDDVRSLNYGSWSPDGEWLAVRALANVATGFGRRDILGFRPGVDSAALPLVATPDFVEMAPALSPDGRWLAYTSNETSNETGRDEVFVRPFPNVDSTRVRVSTNRGSNPFWAKSGRELFFLDNDRGMVAAQFDPVTGRVLALETLFVVPVGYAPLQPRDAGNKIWDVSSDGERFLTARASQLDAEREDSLARFVLVQNFFTELRERIPN